MWAKVIFRTFTMTEYYNKAKGMMFQREVAEYLTKITGVLWKSTPRSGAYRQDWPGDIVKVGREPTKYDNTLIECKNHKTLHIGKWIEETKQEMIDGDKTKWILFFRLKAKIYKIEEVKL